LALLAELERSLLTPQQIEHARELIDDNGEARHHVADLLNVDRTTLSSNKLLPPVRGGLRNKHLLDFDLLYINSEMITEFGDDDA